MSDTIEIEVYASTNRVGSKCTRTVKVDREDWEEMDEQERNDMLSETVWEIIDWGYEVK